MSEHLERIERERKKKEEPVVEEEPIAGEEETTEEVSPPTSTVEKDFKSPEMQEILRKMYEEMKEKEQDDSGSND